MTATRDTAPPRLLAVDDREENLVAIEALLRDEDAVVDRARSGLEALDLLLRHKYALALVDVQMPEMDGFELARLVRGAQRTRDLPIIFITAGAADARRVYQGYDAGAVDFLAKPIDAHALRSKVRVFLELDASRRELAAAAARLTESEAVLEALLQNAPLGMAFLDPNLTYRRVNRALSAMSGIPPERHLGRRVLDVHPGLPGHHMEAIWEEVLETRRPAIDVEISGTTPATRGQKHHWKSSYYPVVAGGRTLGVGVLVRDVTEERRAEELQRLLAGVVSHDLRNPLSVIVNAIQLLQAGGDDPERRRRVLQRMTTAARRMETLIQDLLDYTRVRGGGAIPVDPQETELADVVDHAVEEARGAASTPAAPAVRISIEADGDGHGRWDPARLHQLLQNLLGNALKHGRRDAPVAVRWRGDPDHVELEVRNEGDPIPAAVLPTLFDPLVQGAGPARQGVGLGLFIAREIARAHGGTLEATSTERETVFRLRLPRDTPAAARESA